MTQNAARRATGDGGSERDVSHGVPREAARTYDRAPDAEHDQLVSLLAAGIPAGWPRASYGGYNFITDAEGPDANEIAVYGVQSGGSGPAGEYYAAQAGSQIADLVKTIAALD